MIWCQNCSSELCGNENYCIYCGIRLKEEEEEDSEYSYTIHPYMHPFTYYKIQGFEIIFKRGWFFEKIKKIDLYKIGEIELSRSIFQKIFDRGTVKFVFRGKTHILNNIKYAKTLWADLCWLNSEAKKAKGMMYYTEFEGR